MSKQTPFTDEHEFDMLVNRHPNMWEKVVKSEISRNLERQLAEVREQRDRLATALRTWQRIAYAGANHEGLANARHQTDAALATLKGATNEPR